MAGADSHQDPIDESSTDAASEAQAPEVEAAEESVEEIQLALEAAQTEVASLKDQALRAMAEADNAKRRATKDVENAHKFALDKFAADLLPVVDSLEKAVDAADGLEADADGVKAVGEGVSLSMKLFVDTLKKHGLEQIDPLGEPFDPQHHEAMAMVENPDAEPNSVMDVMQKGYVLNGRLVRAAMVVVAKAPAGPAPGE